MFARRPLCAAGALAHALFRAPVRETELAHRLDSTGTRECSVVEVERREFKGERVNLPRPVRSRHIVTRSMESIGHINPADVGSRVVANGMMYCRVSCGATFASCSILMPCTVTSPWRAGTETTRTRAQGDREREVLPATRSLPGSNGVDDDGSRATSTVSDIVMIGRLDTRSERAMHRQGDAGEREAATSELQGGGIGWE